MPNQYNQQIQNAYKSQRDNVLDPQLMGMNPRYGSARYSNPLPKDQQYRDTKPNLLQRAYDSHRANTNLESEAVIAAAGVKPDKYSQVRGALKARSNQYPPNNVAEHVATGVGQLTKQLFTPLGVTVARATPYSSPKMMSIMSPIERRAQGLAVAVPNGLYEGGRMGFQTYNEDGSTNLKKAATHGAMAGLGAKMGQNYFNKGLDALQKTFPRVRAFASGSAAGVVPETLGRWVVPEYMRTRAEDKPRMVNNVIEKGKEYAANFENPL